MVLVEFFDNPCPSLVYIHGPRMGLGMGLLSDDRAQYHPGYGGRVLIEFSAKPSPSLVSILRPRMGLGMGLLSSDRAQYLPGLVVNNLHRPGTGIAKINHPCCMLLMSPIPPSRSAT